MEHPAGLAPRRMQMITEVGAEHNTTTVVNLPGEFVSMAPGIADLGASLAGRERWRRPGRTAWAR